jgi:hypothetical protein
MNNGIAKNFEVVRGELDDWRALMPKHVKTFREARGGEKFHKALNLVTESVRLLPRTLTYSLLAFVIVDGALHVWLWVR